MIPVTLELKNFLAYRDPGPLRFDGIHVACLAGPNGAGKSSLLDALTWALWGKARTNSPDDLIHQGQKDMHVALTFDQEGSRYKVIRQRRANKRSVSLLELQAWNSQAESWRGISEATIRATQQKIDRLLHLDYETFINSAFLVQGRADEFTTKTPSQRKQVLANILGLSRWETYETRAKERIADTKTAIHRLDGRLEEIERELSQREVHEAELTVTETAAKETEAQLVVVEKQWADLEQTRNELVAFQRQIDDLARRVTATKKDIADAEQERTDALGRADKVALKVAMEDVQTTLAKLDPIRAQFESLVEQRNVLSEEAAQLKGANQALAPQTEPIKARVETLKSATDPICPTCGQPLTKEHRVRLVTELEGEIEGRREQYKANRDRIQALETQIAEVDGQRSALDKQLGQQLALEKRAGELEAALSHAEDASKRAAGLKKKLDRWATSLDEDQRKLESLEGQADQCERRLQAASLTRADVDRLRLEKRMADERVGGARQKIAALDSLEKQREDRLAERGRLAEDLGLYEVLREAFSKRGVPAMIIETVVPELERSANEMLDRMTEGHMHVSIETRREIATGEMREALDIVISDKLGSRSYEMYSGGEAFRINFAIRIALSRLLAHRAGAQLRSLFIDEGFGTQDARGRDHLVEAINSIQEDFDRILVITHIDELKEAFPARIEVSKSPKGSRFHFT
jgi:exonuclease SbcC